MVIHSRHSTFPLFTLVDNFVIALSVVISYLNGWDNILGSLDKQSLQGIVYAFNYYNIPIYLLTLGPQRKLAKTRGHLTDLD